MSESSARGPDFGGQADGIPFYLFVLQFGIISPSLLPLSYSYQSTPSFSGTCDSYWEHWARAADSQASFFVTPLFAILRGWHAGQPAPSALSYLEFSY